jgi:hypothetical protein
MFEFHISRGEALTHISDFSVSCAYFERSH